jgi:large subunit ribosomal protein L9
LQKQVVKNYLVQSNIDIAEALAKGGQSIDRKFILAIVKRTGTASVRLHRDVIVELDYEIVAEK